MLTDGESADELSPGRGLGLSARRSWFTMLGAGLLGLALLVACTSGSGVDASAKTNSPTEDTSRTETTLPTDEPGSPTGTVASPLPNPAPTTIPKVVRPGAAPGPTIPVSPSGFGAAAVFPDGVSVAILKAVKAVETGSGPGVFPGRELVVLDIVLDNASSEPISLDAVVVTTYYGISRQTASPVYPGGVAVKDFSGTAAPGTKASAKYAFAVPTSELAAVTTVVDFDSKHASAVFTGRVQTS